jgi:small subunit ribosomal protein S24e
MDITILEDKRNDLLQRRELSFQVTFAGPTPSRQQVMDKLSALQNLNPALLVIDSLKTTFGKMELKGKARVYDTEEMKKTMEREYLLQRGKKVAEGGEEKK